MVGKDVDQRPPSPVPSLSLFALLDLAYVCVAGGRLGHAMRLMPS